MSDSGYQRDDVPFIPFALALCAWPMCRLVCDRFVRWYSPDYYRYLKSDYERRYSLFFVALLGVVLKPLSCLACGVAVWKMAPEDDIAGFHQPMSPYQQVCWGSRTVIYVSELPHVLHHFGMTMHHLMSLLPMVPIYNEDGPHRWYDLQLAAIISDAVTNLRYLFRQTEYGRRSPNIDWGIQMFGLATSLVRVPALVMAVAMLPSSGIQGSLTRLISAGHVFYMIYVLLAAYHRLRSTDTLQIDESGVFRIRILDHFNINSTSLLTGLAVFGTQMSVIALYSWSKTDPVTATTSELINLTWNTLFAVAIGLMGSRLVAPVLQRIVQARRASSVYFQSCTVFAIIFLCTSPTVDTTIDKKILAACVLLSSSFTKCVSQYASHLACIESGAQVTVKPDEKDEKDENRSTQTRPVKAAPQRASQFCSAINLFQYLVFVLAVVTGYSSLAEAAFRTILVQFVVRAAVDSNFKNTGNKVTTLGSLAILMTLWGLGGIVTASKQHLDPVDNSTIIGNALSESQHLVPLDWLGVLKFTFKDVITLQGLYFLVSATTSYLSKPRPSIKTPLPSMMTVALTCISVWFSYGFLLVWQDAEHPAVTNAGFTAAEILARQPSFCGLMLSWQFWVCISASASIPMVAAHLWLPKTVSQARDVNSDSTLDLWAESR